MKKLLKFVFMLTICAFLLPAAGFYLQEPPEEEVFDPVVSAPPKEDRKNLLPVPKAKPETNVQEKPSFDSDTVITLRTGGKTETLSLREYLCGVLAAEMPAGFPEEALKAQAIAARTYALYKIALYAEEKELPECHHGAQLCDSPAHCEAYLELASQASLLWGDRSELYERRIRQAVEKTDGQILTYQNQPIAAVFCSASTDKTESAKDVWGSELPYLSSVESFGGKDCSRYEGSVRISQKEFADRIRKKYPAADFSKEPAEWFSDPKRSEAGGVIQIRVGGVQLSGREVRRAAGLLSTNFKVKTDGADFVFTTLGCGHGVGMSQYGARYLALDGQTCEQILAHYYPGTNLMLKQ